MLIEVTNYKKLKLDFGIKFRSVINNFTDLKFFLHDVFVDGGAYVVGGFLRDIINGKDSRDLDIIIDLSHNVIIKKLERYRLKTKVNRHNGIKIILENFEVDLWSIDNNWAFKNNLVKQSEDYIVESIANGSFYNYDSLVINVQKKYLNVRHYNDFVKKRTLNILQKNNNYKIKNPTTEANILRAIYLYKLYNISFAENCTEYLLKNIFYTNDQYGDVIKRLIEIGIKYEKYSEILNEKYLGAFIVHLNKSNSKNGLFYF